MPDHVSGGEPSWHPSQACPRPLSSATSPAVMNGPAISNGREVKERRDRPEADVTGLLRVLLVREPAPSTEAEDSRPVDNARGLTPFGSLPCRREARSDGCWDG